MQLFLFL
jgi:hypothetical protein